MHWNLDKVWISTVDDSLFTGQTSDLFGGKRMEPIYVLHYYSNAIDYRQCPKMRQFGNAILVFA